MSDENSSNFKPQESTKERDKLKVEAAKKSASENVTDEPRAKGYQDSFTSFSDGMPAVDKFGINFGDPIQPANVVHEARQSKLASFGPNELLAWDNKTDGIVTDATNATASSETTTEVAEMMRIAQKQHPTDQEKKSLREFRVPAVLGKFASNRDFVPYKYEHGKRVPDAQNAIKGNVIDSWNKHNEWGMKPKEKQ